MTFINNVFVSIPDLAVNDVIMQNWSGHLKWQPAKVCYPKSTEEVQQIVIQGAERRCKVRMIGSGHSFSKLCVTDDFLVSLDEFQGIVSVDAEQLRVTVRAGTKLFRLNEELAKVGLALENMGDINVQSVAGAISTGTHGTGSAFANMSTLAVGMTFVNGLGQIVRCSETEKPELLRAARLSLGSMGVITEVVLQCVPAYSLKRIIDRAPLQDVLEQYPTLNQQHRNFEFYWFPNTEYTMTRTSDLTEEPAEEGGLKDYLQEVVLENYAFKVLNEVAYNFPRQTNRISRLCTKLIDRSEKVSHSHAVFSTPRLVRFNEMEYSVPLDAYDEVKRALVRWVNKNNRHVLFPIENRFVKGDDGPLSPAYGRNSAYIAVHIYNKKDFKDYFAPLEAIFRAHGGRPHWGKIHTLTARDVAESYPEFTRFNELRQRHDPQGLFLSPYLAKLFGHSTISRREPLRTL